MMEAESLEAGAGFVSRGREIGLTCSLVNKIFTEKVHFALGSLYRTLESVETVAVRSVRRWC